MNRRSFLSSGGLLCAGVAVNKAFSAVPDPLTDSGWRTFDVVTKVELIKPAGTSHI